MSPQLVRNLLNGNFLLLTIALRTKDPASIRHLFFSSERERRSEKIRKNIFHLTNLFSKSLQQPGLNQTKTWSTKLNPDLLYECEEPEHLSCLPECTLVGRWNQKQKDGTQTQKLWHGDVAIPNGDWPLCQTPTPRRKSNYSHLKMTWIRLERNYQNWPTNWVKLQNRNLTHRNQ